MPPFFPRIGSLGRVSRRDWLALGLGALATPAFAGQPAARPRAKRVVPVSNTEGTDDGVKTVQTALPNCDVTK